jgi:hypothetical protein
VLESVLVVRALRTDLGAGLDRYYLRNLGASDVPSFNEPSFNAELVPHVLAEAIHQIRESSTPRKPVFAGCCLYVALRNEVVSGAMALHGVLEPFLPALFRLAARGHWVREHRPVRVPAQSAVHPSAIPTATAGSLRLVPVLTTDGELQIDPAIPSGERLVMRFSMSPRAQ